MSFESSSSHGLDFRKNDLKNQSSEQTDPKSGKRKMVMPCIGEALEKRGYKHKRTVVTFATKVEALGSQLVTFVGSTS